ncbi:MAG: homoserine dehydrogenase [Clostridia bacterium]|nr:homoserine dehydrogenase [Clostridia bacterium]
MFNIAILGMGTVGGGVYEVLRRNEKEISLGMGGNGERLVDIKYVLDKRQFPGHELEKRVTTDFQSIIDDKSVVALVETMGGSHPAYEFSKAALESGKSVITSNKQVVAEYGKELFECAKKNNVSYLYEASVGGGIPIISPLLNCFNANRIERIAGILNGTTNYILTQMHEYGTAFDTALKDAQAKGYAEFDPSADILGYDTLRKICILAGIAFGRYISTEDIETVEGITGITASDFDLAEKFGYTIKLLAAARLHDDGNRASVLVAPHLVKAGTPIGATTDVFNAILVTGNVVGDVMFYGSGAGSLPTASAVVSDVLQAIKCPTPPICRKDCEKGFLLSSDELVLKRFVRTDAPASKIKEKFGDTVEICSAGNKNGFIVDGLTVKEVNDKAGELKAEGFEASAIFVL